MFAEKGINNLQDIQFLDIFINVNKTKEANQMTNATQIEGLDLIKAAIKATEEYEDRLASGMKSGCLKGQKPDPQILKDLKAQYPAAAAWVRAEAFSWAANTDKRAAAKEAQELLLAGGDPVQAQKILTDYFLR